MLDCRWQRFARWQLRTCHKRRRRDLAAQGPAVRAVDLCGKHRRRPAGPLLDRTRKWAAGGIDDRARTLRPLTIPARPVLPPFCLSSVVPCRHSRAFVLSGARLFAMSRVRDFRPAQIPLAVLASALVALSLPADSAEIVVDSFNDSTGCTLRRAVGNANTASAVNPQCAPVR